MAAQSLVTVGSKITANLVNFIIGVGNSMGLTLVLPTSVAGSGVAASLLGKVTLTAATSASLNGAFTAAYTNYRIVIALTGASASTLTMALRASGTDSVAANYDLQVMQGVNLTASATQTLAAGSWTISAAALTGHTITIDLMGPASGAPINGLVDAFAWTNPLTTTAAVAKKGILNRLSSAFDGFTIGASTAVSGTISVYGYNAGV